MSYDVSFKAKRTGGVMKIYVSDDIYEYLAIGKRDIHSGVDDDLIVKSLEQHEEEIRKQERLKVIAELQEWVEKASNNYISKFDINGQDALFLVKQKLKEMKGK